MDQPFGIIAELAALKTPRRSLGTKDTLLGTKDTVLGTKGMVCRRMASSASVDNVYPLSCTESSDEGVNAGPQLEPCVKAPL